MTGFPLIIAFIIAVILMIVAISKFKIHPFLSIMGVSLILGLVAGIPLVDVKDANGAVTSQGLANVIGAGFSGTFTSIGIVIILGALIGSILEATGAAFKLADLVILDRNLFEADPHEIDKAREYMTISEGRVIYAADQ